MPQDFNANGTSKASLRTKPDKLNSSIASDTNGIFENNDEISFSKNIFNLNTSNDILIPHRNNVRESFIGNIIPSSPKSPTKRKINNASIIKETSLIESKRDDYQFLSDALGGLKLHSNIFDKQVNYDININATADIDSILQDINTIDEALNYFAKNGDDAPIKFIRLIPNPKQKEFDPYDLLVWRSYDPSVEHFSMSSSGIVHIKPNSSSDCTNMAEWIRERATFSIIRKIPFFRTFLIRKAYSLWLENVKFHLFLKDRKAILDQLFICRYSFQSSILSCNRYLQQISNILFIGGYDFKALRLSDFYFIMSNQLADTSKKAEDIIKHIISNTNKTIKKVTDIASQDTSNSNDLDINSKTTSLIKRKEAKAEFRDKRLKARADYLVLPQFIRYIDTLVLSTILETLLSNMQSFYKDLENVKKVGVLMTNIVFENKSIMFSPNCEQVLENFDNLFNRIINTISSFARVSSNVSLKSSSGQYKISTNISIHSIIQDNLQYASIRQHFHKLIINNFQSAAEYSIAFENIQPIFDFNMNWNLDSFISSPHEISELKMLLDKITNWLKDLERLRNRQIGILEVNSKQLQSELSPLCELRLQEIKDYIKDAARNQSSSLLLTFKDIIPKLSARPSKLKEFCHQLSFVKSITETEKATFRKSKEIDQLYLILQQNEVAIAADDSVLHEDLKENLSLYRNEISLVREYHMSESKNMFINVESSLSSFQESIVKFLDDLNDFKYTSITMFEDVSTNILGLVQMEENLMKLLEENKSLMNYQLLLNLQITEFSDLEKAKQILQDTKRLWTTIQSWFDISNSWDSRSYNDLNTDEIEKVVQIYFKESYNLNKVLKSEASIALKDMITLFRSNLNTIIDFGNRNMKSRHYEILFSRVNLQYLEGLQCNFLQLKESGLFEMKDLIQEISATATGEADLENSLNKIVLAWENTNFDVISYRDQKNLFILGSLEDIMIQLEDHQVTLQTMLGSRYIKIVREVVDEWEAKLRLLSETLDEWVLCQKAWMYLENIFSAEDIQKQLPQETQKFIGVDRSWKSMMLRTFNDPLVIRCLLPIDNNKNITPLILFQGNNIVLEQIQKSLEDYLETKRMAFPRFYFLSNDELLEILSQTRDPHSVQPHMSKCFDAIKRIKFGESKSSRDEINGFSDPLEEMVSLVNVVKAEGPVENWLRNFERSMRNTLFNLAKQAYTNYPPTDEEAISRTEWLFNYPAQVVIAVDQIAWTSRCSNAISQNTIKQFLEFSIRQIDFMVQLTRADLSKLQRTLLGALLTIDVHARDVTRSLISRNTQSLSDFEWTKQLRYYWDVGVDDIVVRQTNTYFRYGYEYLGNSERLVITPLTDICYMTLTGALHMKLGGAPAGPAGTGKTETTKDLAKALAVFCVVFNCSDGLDYKIMGRFFSGLAQQGAWSCFDEFNRIDVEVLSVIAQQILTIQSAILRNVKVFDFEGKSIPLNYAFGVFITMNPGYAGRTELPDNLKSLFRPVAMMVPDYRLIAEIMLFSQGFTNALPLSNKMTQLYALSSEQLSKQFHYDFGMRAVKSVLVAAGQLKRKEPDTNEDILLIRAMRDSNIPKFLQEDLPLFSGIISDLFPGMKIPFVDYGKLQHAIEASLDEMKLQRVSSFITKVIQIHETQLVRHGMMLVGETMSGKSTSIRVLALALGKLYDDKVIDKDNFYKHVDCMVLNPKSITAGQLYGEFNQLSNEWKDGIVPKLVRDCVDASNNGSENRKWIIFDGPVDAIWIENMNTVLDDNKTLCLANSQRIKLPQTLHMLFEVQDLKVASPATVSRCGMVFMEQVNIGVMALVRSWASTTLSKFVSEEESISIISLIESNIEAAITYTLTSCKEKVSSTKNHLTQSFLNLLHSMIAAFDHPADLVKDLDFLNVVLVWCYVYSVGANIIEESRPLFKEWCRKRFSTTIVSRYNALLNNPYGSYIDVKTKTLHSWESIVSVYKYDPTLSFFSILVPTVETTCYRYLLDKLVKSNVNCLLIGETGVGKSVIVSSFLNDNVINGTAISYSFGYSAQTKPHNLKDIFETKLEKKRKNLLGPPHGKSMYLFIDELNMPALETYGAQPPNELLRQCIDSKGFYDTSKLFFKSIQDVVVIAAMGPPGGGRNEVSPRLLSKFHLMWMSNLSSPSMNKVFTTILHGFIQHEMPQYESLAQPIVNCSVDIYLRIQKELLPTPYKSHYTFNLRDLSKVFQGILMIKPINCETSTSLIKLWTHECARVFRDRLINSDDSKLFDRILIEQLKKDLPDSNFDEKLLDNTLFGNFMVKSIEKDYKEINCSLSTIQDSLMEYVDDYNINSSSKMELVFFQDAIFHLARISRILSQPRGNALLVGVGGSGRHSLTLLASYIAEYNVKQIEITRGYGLVEWRDDIKNVLMSTGCNNRPTVFLFSDTQIVSESFLEDLNNILNSGEVPNLYQPDDIERIITALTPLAKANGIRETKDSILQYYTSLIRDNLHLVLCMSPIGSNFRARCRKFPSLVNCCTIDWFSAWPEDALFSVAQKQLSLQIDLGIDKYVENLSHMCNRMHKIVENETNRYYAELKRYNYTTPTSYLELLSLFTNTFAEKRKLIISNENRYRVGLRKLRETEDIVSNLEISLTQMQPFLEQASRETEDLLKQVTADQIDADKQASLVELDVIEANKVAQTVKVIKDDCKADLDEAMPAYEAAVKALATLDKKSIQEIKSFPNPPELVKTTMEAVCILFDKVPDWNEAKKLLSSFDFMDSLKDYKKDSISVKIIKKLDKYYSDPKFVPDEVKKQSVAAMCLCMWVRAMISYDKVAKTIEPKKLALKNAEDNLNETTKALNIKKLALQTVLDRVASLKKQLSETQQKKLSLEKEAEIAQLQLSRAGQLLGGLANEKVRWEESTQRLHDSFENLIGDMCLASGCLAYLGPFTAPFRYKIILLWIEEAKRFNIPCSNFNFYSTLSDPVIVRTWLIDGLPADEFSLENGLLSTCSRRWPLMIDPQGQGNRWIRNTYAKSNLQITKLQDKDLLRTLENAIRYGYPVLIENIGQELDPALEPILLKQIFKKSGQNMIRLADNDVPYNDEFKLFFTTKIANPHYMPEICIKVTIINFTVTMKGLEDQLLIDVVKNERPDLEERKDKLVVSISNDKKALLDIENEILQLLANASGNILDDEELIVVLAKSNTTSATINARLAEAEITSNEINETREKYRTIATRGSIIYFVVSNLSLLDPMYQFSLLYYKDIFTQRLQKTEKRTNLEERLELLIDDITKKIFSNVCRGLFEKDKLLFAFIMGVQINIAAKLLNENEWEVFINGIVFNPEVMTQAIANTGLPDKIWNSIVMLEAYLPKIFDGICNDIATNVYEWKVFIELDNPIDASFPGRWDTELSDFQKLLFLRVIREELVMQAIKKYLYLNLGEYFIDSVSSNLEAAFNDSTSATPLILILSPGADPTDSLIQFSESRGLDNNKLKIISLGQGQGPIAERVLELAMKAGSWVCLQNCHLAVSWLPKLEQIIEKFQSEPSSISKDFRLWLTSMPSQSFPVPILQNGIKLTNEPPRGLKANLRRTFTELSDSDYEATSLLHKAESYKKLLFATAFFNALVLERRKFGPVGWNIPYDWMSSDLRASLTQVYMYIEEQDSIPWETLNVSIAQITYGGRVTDMWDKRTIGSILKRYFTPELINEGFKFADISTYTLPSDGSTLSEVINFISMLPSDDSPGLFGLNPNASITFQQKESKSMLNSIVICAGNSASSDNTDSNSTDQRVLQLAISIQQKLPSAFNNKDAHKTTFQIVGGSMNSLGVFLGQELSRFNSLIQVLSHTLSELQRAIKGEVVMSNELEVMYNNFLFQKVPVSWENAGYPCLKPLASWFDDFLLRIQFMQHWLCKGAPISYWLSGFFFPQGFMTSIKQKYSRDFKIAVDTLIIGCEMTDKNTLEILHPPATGCYVYGLYMEGGRFNREKMILDDSLPAIIYDDMPCIWLKPVVAESYKPLSCYICPLYKTSLRAGTLSTTGHSTNFVVGLAIPTQKDEDYWIRRGTALLTMKDD